MVARRKPRILIADHDQTFLDQLADRAMQLEMSVDFAEDAYTTIELIEAERYDLIVLEVGMPIHNGLEILSIAKKINPDVPVMMIAFSTTKDWAEEALNEGAYTYLLRPLENIAIFDQLILEGLGVNGDAPETPKTPNEFYRAAMKRDTENDPSTSSPERTPPEFIDDSLPSLPVFAANRFDTPVEEVTTENKGRTYKQQRERTLEEVFASLPDGIIELNTQGQILACNKIARDRLVLEAKSPQKPISEYIRSMANKKITETRRIDLRGENAELIVKPITDREGEKRTVIVIREVIEEVKKVQPDVVKTHDSMPTKVSFKNVHSRPLDEYPEEGFSIMLALDRVKEIFQTELDRFLENTPMEWLNGFRSQEAEEVEIDPEMLTAVHRRLSKINGGM